MTWDYLLQHLGDWQGSFTRLTPTGEVETDIPSRVTLTGLDQNQKIRQVIQKFDPDSAALTGETVLEFASLSRSTLFHANGAFSQGSTQFGPISEFGAEFGFVEGDRRLRLVQLFAPGGALQGMTLIREQRAGVDAPARSPLTLADLVGTWTGEAVTLFADLRSPETFSTQLTVSQTGNQVTQQIRTAEFTLTSSAQIEGDRLLFHSPSGTVQVLLLPEGASCTCPLTLKSGNPIRLEVGWLTAPNQRQRLIRQYDAQGGWVGLTLVTEHRHAIA